MKELLISIIASIFIVYIILLLYAIFRELGHLVMYKILFKDNHYKINIGFGKTLIQTKKWKINSIPILSKISYGDKFKSGTYKSIFTHIGGILGAIFFIICLIPLIYIVNKKPDMIDIMNTGITPKAVQLTIRFLVFTLYMFIFPFQIPFYPEGGYVSDGVYIMKDIKHIRESNKVNET